MEYKVIKEKSFIDFQLIVNEYLAKGWELQGGVCSDEWNYLQAMIKK